MRVLVIDVGGSHVKLLLKGRRAPREFVSGPSMTPKEMVAGVNAITADWSHDVISIGFPGVVVHGRIATEPVNLGTGWVGFDFDQAFGRPVKIINDAAMQALGGYQGGRMLFLGFGTGLGSAMIVDGEMQPMELAHLPYRHGKSFEHYVGAAGLKRLGIAKWRHHVLAVVKMLSKALEPDEVVIGGGNATKLKQLPKGVRVGSNANAFTGGFRLWEK